MSHLSLFQLNSLVKKTLEDNLEATHWVVAEIGEMRLNQKGHCYMELVEKEGNFVSAKMKANIWSYTYRNLSGWFESITKTSLQPGMKILFNVSVQFHEVYGMSLNVKDIDPNFTLGERARKKQEVIQQLIDEGIFEMNKLLNLPLVPQKIAIISSESSAGFGDFMSHIKSNPRGLKFETSIFPSLMQGDAAASSIIASLLSINKDIDLYDLVVIIRGGGAQSDLDCFDEFELASYVAQFPIPIITGIGHERDETIIDLVSHTKMKTPTDVADFLINGLESVDDILSESIFRIHQTGSRILSNSKTELNQISSNMKISIIQNLQKARTIINRKSDEFKYKSKESLRLSEQQLHIAQDKLLEKSLNYIDKNKQSLSNFEKAFELLEPSSILKRGYSISRINGKLIKDLKIKANDAIVTEYSGGEVKSIVKKLNK